MTTESPVGTLPVRLRIDTILFGNDAEARIILGGSSNVTPQGHSESHKTLCTVRLDGSRYTGTFPVIVSADNTWKVTIALTASRWGGPPLSLPTDDYVVRFVSADTVLPYNVHAETMPPRTVIDGVCAVTVSCSADATSLTIHVAAPLDDTEFGPAAQARLEAAYRAGPITPENAVFFESFYGHNVSCNPLGIDRAVAERLPDVTRYWSVRDASVAVPEGAVAVIEGSAEWWRVRGSAKLLVVNDWLRKRFTRRRHQKVLQTWHGTPLKKIALSRPGLRLRPALASIRERHAWNILLAQNDHSARTIRRAYAYTGKMWHEGYPRNDVLIDGDAVAVRRSLGIPDDTTVLLYAPTWRDDRPGHIDHLDVARFADMLGDNYLTLIRGHSRTLSPGADIQGNRVLDVTSYPDISQLFLAADALITDYSSVMFDFSVTGKPIYFFAPDLAHYRAQLRGFYFDLDRVAPGPLVQDPTELAELVRDRERVRADYSDRYAAWQKRFNPRDDGNAGRRIVERLVRDGILS
jgi:CDP-glycerol glycerophosphotransferase